MTYNFAILKWQIIHSLVTELASYTGKERQFNLKEKKNFILLVHPYSWIE